MADLVEKIEENLNHIQEYVCGVDIVRDHRYHEPILKPESSTRFNTATTFFRSTLRMGFDYLLLSGMQNLVQNNGIDYRHLSYAAGILILDKFLKFANDADSILKIDSLLKRVPKSI